MTHPYDKVYLSEVIEEQGKFFERLQDMPGPIDSADFITTYMHGYTRRQLDEGHAYYLTLDAEQMKKVFLQESGYVPKKGEPLRGFMPNWIGQFYACAQWRWNVPSAELCDRIPVEALCAVYPGAHDLDLNTAVEKLGRPVFAPTAGVGA